MSFERAIFSALAGLATTSALAQPPACQQGLRDLAAERYADSIQALTSCLQLKLPDKPRAFILQTRARAHAELKQWAAAVDLAPG